MQDILTLWEKKKDTTINGKLLTNSKASAKEEDIQRAKNFKRYKEDNENAEKADKKVRDTGFL